MVDEFLAFSLMASAAAGLAFGLLGFTVWVLVPVVFTMLLGGLVAVWPLSAALWQKFFYVYGPITSLQFGYLLGGIVACVREAKVYARRKRTMRCYFHLVGPRGEVIPDHEGTEVTDLADARAQVLEAVAEYRRGDTTDVRGWRLEVRQGPGSVAFTVALDGPLLGTGDGCDASVGDACGSG